MPVRYDCTVHRNLNRSPSRGLWTGRLSEAGHGTVAAGSLWTAAPSIVSTVDLDVPTSLHCASLPRFDVIINLRVHHTSSKMISLLPLILFPGHLVVCVQGQAASHG